MKDSEDRSERMSEANINALVKKSTKLAKQLSSAGSASAASINRSFEVGDMDSVKEESVREDVKLTDS